ncbi:TIGR03767 family metallophosphoesterase [Paenochrobactrum glaciei]|uniref:TIGR03767 family metallophosphoesterase n=1 Tax=Paenochrobactrum glaciei TaxID=486407 RepID=A0ABP3RWL2_9HYPH
MPFYTSRRNLLKTGLLSGLSAPFISACGCGLSSAFAAEETPDDLTTLTRALVPGEYLSKGKSYRCIAADNGWPIIVREDLSEAKPERESRRKPLVSFAHVTDLHIIDAASPSHSSFLRQYKGNINGAPLSNAARPQDTLTVHVLDAMVRRINAIGKGPVSARVFDFAISTGDNADSRGLHELEAVIAVLNGEKTSFNATGGRYQGLQDETSLEGNAYDAFWHPEPVKANQQDDLWKRAYGYPVIEGFIDAVSEPIASEGLKFPWYTGFGNHDLMDAGVLPNGSGLSHFLDLLATGSKLPTGIPEGMTLQDFIGAIIHPDQHGIEGLIAKMPVRSITAAAKRQSFSKEDFIRLHLEKTGAYGPEGHGFSTENLNDKTAYYTFPMADQITGIMIDSTNPNGGPDGSLDPAQVAWLTQTLINLHARYYDENGALIETKNKNQLIVLFSHHNSRTFDNLTHAPHEAISDRLGSDALLTLLRRFPNIVLWVNGHMHANRVWCHPDPHGRGHGLWEINTAAHIDYPQQARTIEILDNADGTLSIFAVMIDHSDPADIRRTGEQTRASLAALSLELAVNDPALDRPFRLGLPEDLNVELVVRRPFELS